MLRIIVNDIVPREWRAQCIPRAPSNRLFQPCKEVRECNSNTRRAKRISPCTTIEHPGVRRLASSLLTARPVGFGQCQMMSAEF